VLSSIYSLFEQTFLSRLLQWQPLRFIGRLSYGMYLYHEILLPPLGPALIVLKRHHLAVLYPFLAFALTLIVAYLSFRFIESPFLRLKHGLAPRPGAVPDPPPAFSALVAE
jgi:peptidoglycan/LPS O-acetylase OafA/YrhL